MRELARGWLDTSDLPRERTDENDASSSNGWTPLASSPIEPQYFESFDGERLAWREVGEGTAVVLIHGFFSDAETNWIRYGHAAAIAARAFA